MMNSKYSFFMNLLDLHFDTNAVSGLEPEERAFVDFVVQPKSDGDPEDAEIASRVELHFHTAVLVLHFAVGLGQVPIFGFFDSSLVQESLAEVPARMKGVVPAGAPHERCLEADFVAGLVVLVFEEGVVAKRCSQG